MIDETDHGIRTDKELQDKLVADVLKQIEDEVRANHPGMSDEDICALHKQPCVACRTHEGMRGIDVPSAGYVYAPYLPVWVDDCRPWWQGILSWTWWVTRWRNLSLVRWWKRRRLMQRYAKKPINAKFYTHVSVAGTGTVNKDGIVEDYQLTQISVVSDPVDPRAKITKSTRDVP